LISGFRNGFM